MNYKESWYRMKQALQRGIDRNLSDLDNPLNFKIEQYLEGELNLRLRLLNVMINIEKNRTLTDTHFNKRNIQIIVKRNKN